MERMKGCGEPILFEYHGGYVCLKIDGMDVWVQTLTTERSLCLQLETLLENHVMKPLQEACHPSCLVGLRLHVYLHRGPYDPDHRFPNAEHAAIRSWTQMRHDGRQMRSEVSRLITDCLAPFYTFLGSDTSVLPDWNVYVTEEED